MLLEQLGNHTEEHTSHLTSDKAKWIKYLNVQYETAKVEEYTEKLIHCFQVESFLTVAQNPDPS